MLILKQKQTHREQISGYQKGRGGGMDERDEGGQFKVMDGNQTYSSVFRCHILCMLKLI